MQVKVEEVEVEVWTDLSAELRQLVGLSVEPVQGPIRQFLRTSLTGPIRQFLRTSLHH